MLTKIKVCEHLQKQTPKIIKTNTKKNGGGRAPGAPVLDPPLYI